MPVPRQSSSVNVASIHSSEKCISQPRRKPIEPSTKTVSVAYSQPPIGLRVSKRWRNLNANEKVIRRQKVRQGSRRTGGERNAAQEKGHTQIRPRRQGRDREEPQASHCDRAFRSTQKGGQG